MLSDPAYMERAMLAGVRYALADSAIRERVGSRGGLLRAHMAVTIALNANTNGRRGRAVGWLGRALLASPSVVADARFLGALARVVVGANQARSLRRLLARAPQGGSALVA
jgi:hypothetical protein